MVFKSLKPIYLQQLRPTLPGSAELETIKHRQITKLRLSQLKKSEITKLEECETTRGESFICTTFANICIHCSESKAATRMKDLCLRNL